MSDVKKAEGITISPDVKKLMEDIVMAAIVATKQSSQKDQNELVQRAFAEATVRPNLEYKPKCPECRQELRACGEKHRSIVILPANHHWKDDFQGVGLNGVWYKSSSYEHKVTIPEVFDAENHIAKWETEEFNARYGKKHLLGA